MLKIDLNMAHIHFNSIRLMKECHFKVSCTTCAYEHCTLVEDAMDSERYLDTSNEPMIEFDDEIGF